MKCYHVIMVRCVIVGYSKVLIGCISGTRKEGRTTTTQSSALLYICCCILASPPYCCPMDLVSVSLSIDSPNSTATKSTS